MANLAILGRYFPLLILPPFRVLSSSWGSSFAFPLPILGNGVGKDQSGKLFVVAVLFANQSGLSAAIKYPSRFNVQRSTDC